MKKILVYAFTLLSLQATAQTQFLQSGKIEFERRTNTHRLYLSGSDSWVEEFKKLVPQFRTEYFDLYFDGTRSLYRPGKEVDQQNNGFFESPAMANTVFRNLPAQTVISQKQVYESQFLLTDSLQPLEWKLESETRVIAGFECRKAVTRICDSVVVVAFYTDEILAPSGPESFHGLPGMILGIAIPRLYTTWFATKVELLTPSDEKKLVAPLKGKKINTPEMLLKIKDGIGNWGDGFYHKAVWFVSL